MGKPREVFLRSSDGRLAVVATVQDKTAGLGREFGGHEGFFRGLGEAEGGTFEEGRIGKTMGGDFYNNINLEGGMGRIGGEELYQNEGGRGRKQRR